MASDTTWLTDWLDGVVNGEVTMSQRTLSSIEEHGGIATAAAAAEERGVHLLQSPTTKVRF